MRRATLGMEREMATRVTGILGKKVGMTQLFDSKGDVRPVTVLQAGPCVVTQHKSATRDGYESAQIGLVEFVKQSRLTKPAQGHLAKHNLPPVKFMREVPLETDGAADAEVTIKVGDRILVEIFDGERFVDIVGVSKGKGFQGVVAASFCRWSEVARIDVPDNRVDRLFGIPLARVQRHAHVGTHGQRPRDTAQPARAGPR
jgi:ribosomal protein L3